MENDIKIPLPDFFFADIAKDKAKSIIQNKLSFQGRMYYVKNLKTQEFELPIRTAFNDLNSDTDRLVFISEILNFLTEESNSIRNTNNINDFNNWQSGTNKIRYFIYGLGNSLGYTFDKNVFSDEEVSDLSDKVDYIIDKLNELKVGQEVIFNHFDEVIENFKDSKSDYISGKKKWYHRMGGIVLSFAGEKGGDQLWEYLKPQIEGLLKYSPHYIENITKLIS